MLAAVLRLYWIGIGSLDIDEAFTVWVAQHPPREVWRSSPVSMTILRSTT